MTAPLHVLASAVVSLASARKEATPLAPRPFTLTSRLALATALLIFLLIVVGSVVRTTGSGLACPDWPLCEGRWIPRLDFHVLIEWAHRALALCVSVMLMGLAASVFARREVRARLGGLTALALILLFVQILLGALTVWKLLDPSVVSGHLAVALLLFTSVLTVSLVAENHASGEPAESRIPRTGALLGLFAAATTLTWAQAVLGGIVSTHHAGLACPDWPACNGEWFPPLDSLAGIQMMHRWGAYVLTAVNVAAFVAARRNGDPVVRAAAQMALSLNLVQLVLGVCNVLLGTPVWVSALHLATATAMLAMLVSATYRIASAPSGEELHAAVVAR